MVTVGTSDVVSHGTVVVTVAPLEFVVVTTINEVVVTSGVCSVVPVSQGTVVVMIDPYVFVVVITNSDVEEISLDVDSQGTVE